MFFNVLQQLCNERGIAVSALLDELGMSRGNIARWKSGLEPKASTKKRIANFLNVTISALEEKPITDSDGLTEADRRDIAIELEQLMNEMTRSGNLMFDGDPATPEAMESLRNAMEMGLIYAKKINKDKLGK